MSGNSLIKKGLAVAVILLFIGVAFAPSINANVVKDDLVEFDVEFCGLGKKHTVKLTQQEADEVGLLFDDIEQRLSEVETREGAEEIFKEAIVELDKYGLLGGLSVRFAQNLVTGKYGKSFKNEIPQESTVNDGIHNSNCLVFGRSLLFTVFDIPDDLYSKMTDIYWFIWRTHEKYALANIFRMIVMIYFNIKPIHKNVDIGFGTYGGIPGIWEYSYPARGSVFTIGDEGKNSIHGKFYGSFGWTNFNYRLGVRSFTGIKILNNYFGSATEIGLQYEQPWV